ncbi:MAG: DUF1289 domain-containing protein [Betaproteobacteria bacterium]
MNDPLPEVPSPCTSVCQLDPHTSLCRGCLRTIQEIASWAAYTAPEKRAVLARIAQRRAGATSGV